MNCEPFSQVANRTLRRRTNGVSITVRVRIYPRVRVESCIKFKNGSDTGNGHVPFVRIKKTELYPADLF